MYTYQVSTGNPEGFSWIIEVTHEKKYTSEEWQIICELIIVRALENEFKECKYAFASSIDSEFMFEQLILLGFKGKENKQANYYFDPYPFSTVDIKKEYKLKTLQDWMKRKSYTHSPAYMRKKRKKIVK